MLTSGTSGTIYVAVDPQDGRKGIDGLAGVVRTVLGRDPASGDLFVFKNRRMPAAPASWQRASRSLRPRPSRPNRCRGREWERDCSPR